MKVKFWQAIFVSITLAFASTALAATVEVTGKVAKLVTSDSIDGANNDWVQLAGVTAVATCPLLSGSPVFRIRDDGKGNRQFAYLLTAQTAGTPVTIGINDAVVGNGGFCMLGYVYH